MDSYALDSSYSYGSLVEMIKAILAAKILAPSDAELLGRLKDYSKKLKDQVVAKDEKLQSEGYKAFL